jgi:hypothetical protein
MEMRLPNWARAVIAISAAMQAVFGATLLYDPSAIANVWPWSLPPLSARLLGASALVSVPMSLLAVAINRFVPAMIPLVMMITYRVLQIAAGLVHVERFQAVSPVTWNYFGGGALMFAVYAYCLWAGLAARLPEAKAGAPMAKLFPWRPPQPVRIALIVLAAGYAVLGLYFLIAGGRSDFWIDGGGVTPLTARLFSSPLIGLALGLYLCSRATDWRSVAIPAAGLATIGVFGTLALFLERATMVLPTPVSWLVAATPLILLAAGLVLLLSRPRGDRPN